MSNGLRVGIAGYGLAGRFFHGRLLKGSGFEVVGIVTKDDGRANSAREDFPSVRVVAEFSELLHMDLDLIVIATANSVHASQSIAALEAGVPVVVDKPMALNFSQTEEVVLASRRTGVPITVFFNRRWDSDALTIKKLISEGTLGEVFRLDSRFERFRPNPTAQTWRTTLPASEGGGTLLDLQSHLVSLALDWFGPAAVGYSSIRSVRGMSDDDVVIVLNHASGVDSYLSASAIVGSPGPRIRLMGDKGALVISELDPQEALLRKGKFPVDGVWQENARSKAKLVFGSDEEEYEAVPGSYGSFYEAIKLALVGNGEWPVSTADALAVAKIIDVAREVSVRE